MLRLELEAMALCTMTGSSGDAVLKENSCGVCSAHKSGANLQSSLIERKALFPEISKQVNFFSRNDSEAIKITF